MTNVTVRVYAGGMSLLLGQATVQGLWSEADRPARAMWRAAKPRPAVWKTQKPAPVAVWKPEK